MDNPVDQVRQILACDELEAKRLLKDCNGNVELAIETGLDPTRSQTARGSAWAKRRGGAPGPASGSTPEASRVAGSAPPSIPVPKVPPPPAPTPAAPVEPEDPIAARVFEITGCSKEQAIQLVSENGGDLEAALRAYAEGGRIAAAVVSAPAAAAPPAQDSAAASSPTDIEVNVVYALDRNWHGRPQEVDKCLSLIQGEHVQVLWTDGRKGGWVYAEVVGSAAASPEDKREKGYCPEAILMAPRPRAGVVKKGSRVRGVTTFKPPLEVGGFL
eukprot:CAMPEP_0178442056 /NCGR_PEP_ID=MMETSP0689_2-20121128/37917_1 /TAXON_ID=160604 /ORGANISM="Amphidinium massartii, Strain CS-259" /LENGTH=271 /DNA_ID=CAMNT_0020065489 /DNA_START=40 /DNA_END=852 /DNA_ORIENTATION=-